MKKYKTSLILNIIIFILVIVGTVFMLAGIKIMGEDIVLANASIEAFKFFTVDSNLLMGIAAAVFAYYDYLIIGFGTYTDKPEKFYKYIHDFINNIDGYDEELFELTKKNTIINFILRDDNVLNVVIPFIDNIIDFDYPYMDKIEDIKSFNFKEYKEFIKKLDFSNEVVTTIKNKESF